MDIKKIDSGVLCDMGGCVRKAAYAVSMEGKPLSSRLYLCPECAANLYGLLGSKLGGEKEVEDEEDVRRRDC